MQRKLRISARILLLVQSPHPRPPPPWCVNPIQNRKFSPSNSWSYEGCSGKLELETIFTKSWVFKTQMPWLILMKEQIWQVIRTRVKTFLCTSINHHLQFATNNIQKYFAHQSLRRVGPPKRVCLIGSVILFPYKFFYLVVHRFVIFFLWFYDFFIFFLFYFIFVI